MARAGQDPGELMQVSPQWGPGYATLLYTEEAQGREWL